MLEAFEALRWMIRDVDIRPPPAQHDAVAPRERLSPGAIVSGDMATP